VAIGDKSRLLQILGFVVDGQLHFFHAHVASSVEHLHHRAVLALAVAEHKHSLGAEPLCRISRSRTRSSCSLGISVSLSQMVLSRSIRTMTYSLSLSNSETDRFPEAATFCGSGDGMSIDE